MRLIKLLYIAERESLGETGRPITGDHIIAMEQGPVLSHVLDLIKDQDAMASQWGEFVEREDYNIRLAKDPGNDELSLYEIQKLQDVWDRYRTKDEWEMVQMTHEFPEWKKNDPGKSSKPIPLADILEAVGRKGDLEKIEETARQSAAFGAFFGG
jgi:uncharacterized phage-associated protein